MCVPPAAMAGLTLASGVMDFMAADDAAKQQSKYAALNRQIATQDALSQYEALAARETQEREAAAQSIAETRRASAAAQGTARVAAGGTGGASVAALLDDFSAQEARSRSATIRNLEFRSSEFARARQGVRRGLHTRLAANQPVARPDFFGAALRLGVQAGSAYFAAGGGSKPDNSDIVIPGDGDKP